MKLRHFSKTPVNELDQRDYEDQKRMPFKPAGFWVSDESSDYGWKQWCMDESFRLDHLKYEYEVVLKNNCNILFLKTADEIIQFTREYAKYDTFEIEWQRIKKKHDGIIITPYQWSLRYSFDVRWYYPWDCASGCIWNVNVIQEIKLVD